MTQDQQLTIEKAIKNYIEAFEKLSVDSIDELLLCFDDTARFIDPFNDINGKSGIQKVFLDMFEKTNLPHFTVDSVYIKDASAMMTWSFYFQLKKKNTPIEIQGCSKIILNTDGKIILHKDFWDPCQGLYEKIPVIRFFFKKLRKRLEVK